ncbi:MAG: hypothetical protein MUE85_17550 [Microscillaceae bacterium]|jgi:hypothetical protein|nr:hypothetical protein [Microscillaceae bacterium]
MQLIIKEENFAGKILDQITLQIADETLTVANLIKLKVETEVATQNLKIEKANQGYHHALENTLNRNTNAYNSLKTNTLDAESQVYRAWEAYKNNQIIVLVDNRQTQGLEEEILVSPETQVSFIRLTQLVGG